MPSDKAIGIQPILLFTYPIYDLAYDSIDSLLKVGKNSLRTQNIRKVFLVGNERHG